MPFVVVLFLFTVSTNHIVFFIHLLHYTASPKTVPPLADDPAAHLRAQGVRKFSKNFEDLLYICLQMCYNKITESNTTHNIMEVQNYENRY